MDAEDLAAPFPSSPRPSTDKSALRTGGCGVLAIGACVAVWYYSGGSANKTPVPLALDSFPGVETVAIASRPRGDNRRYQHSTFTNGLQVINVEDPRAVQAAFSVAVTAGQLDDPVELPGLAHFCEHMLFLGTDKYPDPSGYDKFLAQQGGVTNAYTDLELTNYFTQVSASAAEATLDRLADFFRAPSFNTTFVEHEVHAIDSEHAKNVQNPSNRAVGVMLSLASPESPLSRFHVGNLQTLYEWPKGNNTDTVEALRVYFHSNYCPSRMRVVTFGPQPLHEQLRFSVDKLGDLESGSDACQNARRSWSSPEPWPSERLGKWVTMLGTQPQASLWLHFPLPDTTGDYKSQPLAYIQHVLMYGGEGSLRRVLQDELGLVTEFQAMGQGSSSGMQFFVVSTLTAKGREHPELVMDAVFAYLGALRRGGVDESLYRSLRDVTRLEWDWAAPQDGMAFVSSLSKSMTMYPPESVLGGNALIHDIDTDLVTSLLGRLQPDNMNVGFVDPAAFNSTGAEEAKVQTLPHYGVRFSVAALGEQLPDAAQRWAAWLSGNTSEAEVKSQLQERAHAAGLRGNYSLPVPPTAVQNVPTELSLDAMHAPAVDLFEAGPDQRLFGPEPESLHASREEVEGNDAAIALLHAQDPEVWYRRGWVTTSPKASLKLTFRPIRADGAPEASATDVVRLQLYSLLLSHAMEPKVVDLENAGCNFGITVSSSELSFEFSGFTPVMPALIHTALAEFNSFNNGTVKVDAGTFERMSDASRDQLGTYDKMPIEYALVDRNLLITKGPYSRTESLSAINNVTLGKAVSSVNELLLSQPLKLTSLVMGNLNESEGRRMVSSIADGIQLPSAAALLSVNTSSRAVERMARIVNISAPVEARLLSPREGDDNDAVVVSLIHGVGDIKSRVLLSILGDLLHSVAFDYLRTDLQLGYVVDGGAAIAANVQYVSAIVQGTRLHADQVEAAIEHVFTNLMPAKLADLSDEDFGAFKASLTQKLLKPPSGFAEEVAHFWKPVDYGGICFGLRDAMLSYANESLVSKDLLVEAWQQLALPSSGVRRKVAVKYFAREVPERMDAEQAEVLWKAQELSAETLALLRREHEAATVLDRVDARARSKLVEQGGYFPQDMHCGSEDDSSDHGGEPTKRSETREAVDFLELRAVRGRQAAGGSLAPDSA